MTRFARAKGSKSSNERKPEDATSWLEMRSAMLSKKSNQQEEKLVQEEPVKRNTPKKAEWASLGSDTFSESISLMKEHMGKICNGLEENKEEKKKKKKEKTKNETEVNQTVSDTSKRKKKKNKKQKNSAPSGVVFETEVKKKGKKRKLVEGGVGLETSLPKKKKKLQKSENADSSTQETRKQIKESFNSRPNEKLQNKKGIKSKQFRKKNNDSRSVMSKKGKHFEGQKKFKNKNYQERKSEVEELIINGEKIPITKFQGFYVTLEDAERLKNLRSEMIKEGIPKVKLEAAIKLERRRAEKALSRLKKSVCFHCRNHGHLLSNCPNLVEKENTGTGICYKCGSTEHSAAECKVVRGTNYQFAECFICKEQGHIARQCPDNPRGLYPQGGACRECGDVTHLRKDCPKVQAQKAEDVVTVGLTRDRDLECLDEEITSREKQSSKKRVKKSTTVKF